MTDDLLRLLEAEEGDEMRATSKRVLCPACGHYQDMHRYERGIYVCAAGCLGCMKANSEVTK